jgi:hypothetical protein
VDATIAAAAAALADTSFRDLTGPSAGQGPAG